MVTFHKEGKIAVMQTVISGLFSSRVLHSDDVFLEQHFCNNPPLWTRMPRSRQARWLFRRSFITLEPM